jgi:tetratricopeptide (TPR) repeat protein
MKVVKLLLMALMALNVAAQTSVPASQKVIKDAAEYNAYLTALNTQDPGRRGTAMLAFANQYPASLVRIDALEQAMAAYQESNNATKVVEIARTILQQDPPNVRALAIVTAINRSLATNGDAQALKESCDDAQKGLQTLATWAKPQDTNEQDFEKLKNQMTDIFNGAAGFCALQTKDYARAKNYYLKAIQVDPSNLQDVYQLAVSDLESKPMDVDGFWYIAKSSSLAQGNSAAQQSINSYGSAKYRHYHGSADGWDKIASSAGTQALLPVNFASSIKPAPSPAEVAVTVVRENDPGTLSFSDWEYILGYRDASTDNKQAADRVWQAIREDEKNGQVKLRIHVKVISATKTKILAAITDENQKVNTVDLNITMEQPLLEAPIAGAQLDVIGVLTDYTPNPFAFYMEQAALATPSPK